MRNKTLFLIVSVALLILPAFILPMYSFVPDRVHDMNMNKDFAISAYGDESTESITSFSETLPDDVLFYPDQWFNETWDYANSETGDDTSSGSLSDTYSSNNIDLYYTKSAPATAYVELTFSYPSGPIIDGFNYTFEIATGVGDDDAEIELYDWVGVGYDDLHTSVESTSDTVYTGQITDSKYIDSVNGVKFKLWSYEADSGSAYAYVDQIVLEWFGMTLNDSEHYAESFADISDWSPNGGSAAISTDGDVMLTTTNAVQDGAIITGLSIDAEYIEARARTNGTFAIEVYDGAWTTETLNFETSSSYGTLKAYIGDEGTITQIRFRSRNTGVRGFWSDYLRISPANETGWQFDASTTVGLIDFGGTPTLTSTGDILRVVDTHASSSGVTGYFDTTATISNIDLDYYPFIEIRYNATTGQDLRLRVWDDDATAKTFYLVEDGTYNTGRFNLLAHFGSDELLKFDLYDEKDNSQDFTLDYIKCYSIANWSYSHDLVDENAVLYVDSSVLYSIEDAGGWMNLRYDPVLDVNTTIYTSWNATGNDGLSTYFRFRHYTGSWEWENVGDTTGDLPVEH